MMRRLLSVCAVVLAVAGCAGPAPFADDAEIAAVSYRDGGPPSLTLYTMVNNRSGSGAHTSLMINASERVIFDPAGSFRADIVPERNDVLYGITPAVERAYRSSHARSTHHVVVQTIQVSPEIAELAYHRALKAGPVAGAFCARSTSEILASLPGFEQIQPTFYPNNLRDQFAKIPGVTTDKQVETDSGDLDAALDAANDALNADALTN